MTEKLITCLPNAASLIESMRSIGYSFETAIADIIDNSISAQASRIDIFFRQHNDQPYIQILDNGSGMNNQELLEAMRLGSKNPTETRDKDDLGRFGLGLKSASFSQVRKLTVLSKKDGEIHAYQWDLDIVSKTQNFDIRFFSGQEIAKVPNINYLSDKESGTIIQWEEFDRLTNSTNDLTEELSRLVNKTIDHIALIFHRFLTKRLEIFVNYNKVIPKDPFLLNHPGTQERKSKKIKIDGEIIELHPYVLPHLSKLSAADQRLSGKINEQARTQGFYLYRNERLIVWGDYLGLSRKTELGKNLRIQVDIPNTLDYLWDIDVKKSRARVPSKISRNLISAITDGELVSKEVNTYRGKKELTDEKPIWSFYEGRDGDFYFELNSENELYKQLKYSLTDEQLKLFNLFERGLVSNIPIQTIYAQIADGKESKVSQDDEVIISLVETITTLKENEILNYKELLKSLLVTEPFSSNKKAVKIINSEIEKAG
ncbi:ATP-binding protein [Enterococcus hirae]|nr:ATP-binding protein [Enterococcus hirae]